MKLIEVEYIQKGSFQGGDEDCSTQKIRPGDTCFIMTDGQKVELDGVIAELGYILGQMDKRGGDCATFASSIRGALLPITAQPPTTEGGL